MLGVREKIYHMHDQSCIGLLVSGHKGVHKKHKGPSEQRDKCAIRDTGGKQKGARETGYKTGSHLYKLESVNIRRIPSDVLPVIFVCTI